jgi:outer membrane receptor protein involved in Fe transport
MACARLARCATEERDMKRSSTVLPVLAGLLLSVIFTTPILADDNPPPSATGATPVAAAQATTATAAPAAGTVTAPRAATVPQAATTPVSAPAVVAPASDTAVLGTIEVQSKRLNLARDTLNPETGTSNYHFDTQAIAAMPQGENSSLQQLVLQAPGVAKDSFGQLHVRGDHADIQYRINGAIVPEFISGFGDALGTRFIDKLDFVTGSVPAQYGYRTAGIINITTNTGLALEGGAVDIYGGSQDTIEPSVEYGGTSDRLDYYATGTYYQSNLGIESPTSAANPIHDDTEQDRGFVYASDILNPNLRTGAMIGHSLGNFQIPNNPGLAQNFQLQGVSSYPSADLNETQRELNDYGIVYLQGINGALNYQVSLFNRYSSTDFHPDNTGDLIYNGIATTEFQRSIATGIQADMSYELDDAHTLRWGLFSDQERTSSYSSSLVFPANPDGSQSSDVPETIPDATDKTGELYGLYVQDEWKATQALVVNYGARYDISNGFVRESQFSPRINTVYSVDPNTQLHLGYSRYFTPPFLELIQPKDAALFNGTTGQLPFAANSPVVPERDDYYDAGITHNFTPALHMGLDGYYKDAKHLLDEGQFGAALIFSPFNYVKGRVWGLEYSENYDAGDFSQYFNLAYSRALGSQVESGQYNFDPDELSYIQDHFVHLDHDQTWSSSGGVAYNWSGTRTSLDYIFGSGLRQGFANTESLPSYAQFDLSASRHFEDLDGIDLRFTIANLFDRVYEIRSGTGIGVGAPQFGARRGFFLGVTKTF